MEGGAAGGRGGAGGARGKSKKARARAKAAAAASAAAAVSAAAAAPTKQSAGKKVAAADGAQAPAAAKTKALKAAKAGRAATAAGVQAATAVGTGVATRLTRKKVAGAKSVAKLKMGTVAAAAAVAAAQTAPKKRATTKKKQQQETEVAAVPAAVVDTVTHVHSAAKTSELATVRAHDAAATSTVVPLTGGKRARGKKRRASSIGASDHESSASVVAAESAAAAAAAAAATPTPAAAAAAAAEHEAPVHIVHPHHIVDLNKHSPSSEPRIVFLGGAAARDNAKQDLVTGATSHNQVAPPASMPHDDHPKSTASPTARAKKVKAVKKGPVRAKTVGNGSDASKKIQVTKAGEPKMTTRLQKKTAERQLQPNITESDPSVALSVLAAAATTHHTVVASSSPLAIASGGAVTRSHDAQTLTDAVGNTVGGEHDNNADAPKQGAKVVTEASSDTSGSTSGLVASAPSVKSPIREMMSAPPHSQLTQQQLEQSSADSSSTTTPETQPERVADALKTPTPVMATLRSELAPAQPPTTTSKSSEVIDAAPSITTASVVRSDSKEEEALTTAVKMGVAVSAPVPQSKTSATKKEPPSQVSTEAPTAQAEHANNMEQESTINAQKSGLPLVEDFPPPSLSPVEEVIEKQAPEPVAPPSATHPDATPLVTSSLPRVTIPEPVLSEKDPRDGEDGGDGVTSPATQALRRIFSGEMKRLRAVRFERLSAITEHPTSESKPMAKTSKKRRREDNSTDNETSQLQTVATHHPMVAAHRPMVAAHRLTARKPAPKEPPSFGIIMDSHAYVDKMMRSDPVANPTPKNEELVRQQPPITLPSNSWGASFGFAGGAAVFNHSVPPSPRSPLASTRPLSSWFLSKGAANFVKRVSFKHESSAFGSPEPSKRRRVSVAAEDGTSSRSASNDGESEENAFLASLASKASWRSWYTSDDKKPADSLLDSIPASRLPRELLDHPIEPMALDDGGEPASLPNTDATVTTGASTTTATSTGRASELERLEQEIRVEKRRARAFERMLLLVLQGKAASGREFEDEYGSALAPSRPSRPAK